MPDPQAGWPHATLGLLTGRQAAEAHAALHLAVFHRREDGMTVALAKGASEKACGREELGRLHTSLFTCADQGAEVDILPGALCVAM